MGEAATRLPGVRFEVRPPATQVSPLRTDIAGFIGPTWRGPVNEAARVEGWRAYQELFGELTHGADTAYAVRGYFENGGEVAYVVRLLGGPEIHAEGLWKVGEVDAVNDRWEPSAPGSAGFRAAVFRVVATTPGNWANDLKVRFRYRRRGPQGRAEVDIEVRPARGAPESLPGLPAADLAEEVAKRSRLIRLVVAQPAPPSAASPGPLAKVWDAVALAGGVEAPPGRDDYDAGARLLAETREVALMAAPDLHVMPGGETARDDMIALMAALAEEKHDRQVVAETPPGRSNVPAVLAWLGELRAGLDEAFPRSLAFYHPRLAVPDPLGGLVAPLREISPVGHVAGVISRLDRERGAHHTPANAEIYQAVDLARRYGAEEQGALAMGGINPLLCAPGNGLVIWGGRTAHNPALGSGGLFLAHRRLIHRLIRAIRRVAEPLVFEVNGPDLWLILARAITSVLLEAWHAGALKGDMPEQAFRVRCDESTNPRESEDAGEVLCEVLLAPAAPMEFIALRIAITREGRLEAIEA